MNSEQMILYRLDQQDKSDGEFRLEVKQSISKVLDQCVKTNGRVSSLEKWRYTITGALIVISLIIGWVVTLKGNK